MKERKEHEYRKYNRKQYILIRKDLEINRDELIKYAAKVSRNCYRMYYNDFSEFFEQWFINDSKTVILEIENEEKLLYHFRKAAAKYIPAYITKNENNSYIMAAIGPCNRDDIEWLRLKTLKNT